MQSCRPCSPRGLLKRILWTLLRQILSAGWLRSAQGRSREAPLADGLGAVGRFRSFHFRISISPPTPLYSTLTYNCEPPSSKIRFREVKGADMRQWRHGHGGLARSALVLAALCSLLDTARAGVMAVGKLQSCMNDGTVRCAPWGHRRQQGVLHLIAQGLADLAAAP